MMLSRFSPLALLALGYFAAVSVPTQASAAVKRPVKVFVLAGQSNMEGKAAASTLKAVIDDDPENPQFKHLTRNGKWTARDDVWVTFLCKTTKGPASDVPLYGPLTVGFGSQKSARDDNNKRITVPGIGPELGIGHVLGDHFKEQVLLIKAAWGGRSVKYNFRSPSAMPSEEQLKKQFAKLEAKRPELEYDDWKAGFGQSYRDMIAEVRKVTGNLKQYFANYDPEQGFEVAGLIWFQGWNDGVGGGNPDYVEQLAALIRDVRQEFGVPDMPVVIGELGIDGPDAKGWIATFRAQQAAVAALPEFKDNVRLAKTAQSWPNPPDLSEEWEEFRANARKNEAKPKDDPTRIDPGDFFFKNWVQRYKDQRKYTSDKRYHYLGSGKSYYQMGESMGKAMVELLK